MERAKIQEKLSRIISNILEKDYELINESHNLVDDIDSMGFLELAIWVQREFKFSTSSDNWKNLKTMSDLLDLIEKNINSDEKI